MPHAHPKEGTLSGFGITSRRSSILQTRDRKSERTGRNPVGDNS